MNTISIIVAIVYLLPKTVRQELSHKISYNIIVISPFQELKFCLNVILGIKG